MKGSFKADNQNVVSQTIGTLIKEPDKQKQHGSVHFLKTTFCPKVTKGVMFSLL